MQLRGLNTHKKMQQSLIVLSNFLGTAKLCLIGSNIEFKTRSLIPGGDSFIQSLLNESQVDKDNGIILQLFNNCGKFLHL